MSTTRPTTLVEQIADGIVEAAAQGCLLPGDPVIEGQVARCFNAGRVSVREALRLLERDGIIVALPFQGMRMMEVSNRHVQEVFRVRLALEQLGAREALALAQDDPALFDPMEALIGEMDTAARANDALALARLDTAFHRMLCGLAGNRTLIASWEPLARQLTVIFGLSVQHLDRAEVVDAHRRLLGALRAGAWEPVAALLQHHIVDSSGQRDYELFVERLRHPADG